MSINHDAIIELERRVQRSIEYAEAPCYPTQTFEEWADEDDYDEEDEDYDDIPF